MSGPVFDVSIDPPSLERLFVVEPAADRLEEGGLGQRGLGVLRLKQAGTALRNHNRIVY